MPAKNIQESLSIQYVGGSCGDILKTLLYVNLNSHMFFKDLEVRNLADVVKVFHDDAKIMEVIKKTGRCAPEPTDKFISINRNLLSNFRMAKDSSTNTDMTPITEFLNIVKTTTDFYIKYYNNIEDFNWQLKKHDAKFSVSSGHEAHELILKYMPMMNEQWMKTYYNLASAYQWDRSIFITVPSDEESKLHVMFANVKNNSLYMPDDSYMNVFIAENKYIHDYIVKYKNTNDIIITLKDIVIKDRLIKFMNDHNFNVDLKLLNTIYDIWWEYQPDNTKEYIKGME